MNRLCYLLVLLLLPTAVLGQKSPKRGIGWDESEQPLTAAHAEKISAGVAWVYNWGNTPRNQSLYGADALAFAPMCWNNDYDENAIRNYLTSHPETKYLLGFNEPNFSSQASMTPAKAAAEWPRLEKIAADFGLMLVTPALNFSGEIVGGRTWDPYEWLNEFLTEYPEAHFDCLALHSYMNWYGANTWFATEYFYKDLYDTSKKDVYGRYPAIVAYLDKFKETNGHFPRMMLTEFCSWENDGTITGVDFQIDQMTQKVQKLELSDLVEGYAWFMGNAEKGAAAYPYMSIFQTNTAESELSELGTVYVNMSPFDDTRFYAPDETVEAQDYLDATTDDQQVRLRRNTEAGSQLPLQVEFPSGAWAKYQICVPQEGEYRFTMHIKSNSDNSFWLYVDSKKAKTAAMKSTAGEWTDRSLTAGLPAGNHSIMVYNAGSEPFLMNSLSFTPAASDGIETVDTDETDAPAGVYNLAGIRFGEESHLPDLPGGIYIIVSPAKSYKVMVTDN